MTGMATLRPLRPLVVLGALVLTASLASCSTGGGAGASAQSPTPTAAASEPADAWAASPDPMAASMDEDRSAAAICGQISALSTVSLNASDGLQRGTLTEEQYEALTAAERFGYEHLSSTDARLDDAIDYAHEYLDQHPAPTSGAAIVDGPEWDLVQRTLNAACRDAGSNITSTAQYGG